MYTYTSWTEYTSSKDLQTNIYYNKFKGALWTNKSSQIAKPKILNKVILSSHLKKKLL